MLPILNNDPRMFTDFRSSSISYNQLKQKIGVQSDEEFKKYLQQNMKPTKKPVVEYYGCGCSQCGGGKNM